MRSLCRVQSRSILTRCLTALLRARASKLSSTLWFSEPGAMHFLYSDLPDEIRTARAGCNRQKIVNKRHGRCIGIYVHCAMTGSTAPSGPPDQVLYRLVSYGS